jgi:hypothetical protein
MWAGSPTEPPTGWTLCDGNDGTPINGVTIPDLRERFIVGAGGRNSEIVTYDFTSFNVNSSFSFGYVGGTFNKVADSAMVQGTPPNAQYFYSPSNQGSPGTPNVGRQYALYSLVGNSAATSYFLVYHQGRDNYVLYRGTVPADGTAVTSYPSVQFPSGSIAVLSQTGNTITHRPNIREIEWKADINGYTVGEKGGFNNVRLYTSEMPSHNHTRGKGDDNNLGGGPTQYGWQALDNYGPPPATQYPTTDTGGNFPHENRPPYYALAFIIYTGA